MASKQTNEGKEKDMSVSCTKYFIKDEVRKYIHIKNTPATPCFDMYLYLGTATILWKAI